MLRVLVAASMLAAAGGGTISATAVGPLRLGHATPAQVQAFAGAPQHTWTFAGNGMLPGNGLFAHGVRIFGYGCREPVAKQGCTTLYAFKGGKLIGLWTRSPAFHTAAGTRVGTGLAAALRKEKVIWSGFQVQCPAISFPASAEFKADVVRSPARIADFLVTLSPRSFADGC